MPSFHVRYVCMLSLLTGLAAPPPARADNADGTETAESAAEPWAEGVGEEAREAALALFREGNELFTESEYAEAAERYRRALSRWDHPRIHGNLATALIHLDDPLGAMAHIEEALRYGARPFEPHVHAQLLTNQKLLIGQLAKLTVRSEVAGAALTLDGKPLFVGPGEVETMVRSGRHEAVARKEGHLTETRAITALGGETVEITLDPVPLSQATRYVHRWAVWKPWLVLGAGGALAASGIPLGRAAVTARDDYEQGLAEACPRGCTRDAIPESVHDYRDRARRLNRVEVAAYVSGGLTAAVGVVLLTLNRGRPVTVRPDGAPQVTPIATAHTLGAMLHMDL